MENSELVTRSLGAYQAPKIVRVLFRTGVVLTGVGVFSVFGDIDGDGCGGLGDLIRLIFYILSYLSQWQV